MDNDSTNSNTDSNSSMDVDFPPEPTSPLKPRDRVLRRLARLGVPQEYLDMVYEGIVAFVVEDDNRSWIPELVSVILPPDEEVAEALQDAKVGAKKALNPTMNNRFRESMVWLQWLMFLCEPVAAQQNLSSLSAGRGVCGAVWGNNDIAYRCRTCEHDPTCAICVPCFLNGNHKDHDYSIIYTGGGCCDCGDVTAWKREGFCSNHKGAEQIQPLPENFSNSVAPVLDALLSCWKSKLVSADTICEENSRESECVAVRKKAANELTFVVVEMLLEFCKNSESLLSFVSRRVSSLVGLLEILVRAERFLGEGVIKKLHELLLKLLGEPIFKYEFAKVFLNYYPFVVHEVVKEGTEDALKKRPLLSTFSVQIFTVPTLTPRLVMEMNLLAVLLGCLGDIFVHCAGDDGRLQVNKWGNIYETTIRVVEDIRFVMSHALVTKFIINERRDIVRTWMKLLSFLQGMSALKRETGLHLEEENEKTNIPFVLGHSAANIHSLLVDGAFSTSEETGEDVCSNTYKQYVHEGESARHAKVGRLTQESSVGSVAGRSSGFVSSSSVTEVRSDTVCGPPIPSSVKWLTYECLKAIENWLGVDNLSGLQLSPNTSSNSTGNFLALKKTYALIRKGKYFFGGLTSSSEDNRRECSSSPYGGLKVDETENSKFAGKDHKTVVPGESDSARFDDSMLEGNGSTDLDALRVLSLSDWPDIIYDVSLQDVSVHIPLHRLLSLLIQKALRRCYGESSFALRRCYGESSFSTPLFAKDDFFGYVFRGCHPYGFSAFVMEHPLRNRAFCAQVHAGMWRKNGDAAILSSEWYRTVRWAEQGLELDLFLLQCCAALAPADLYVLRIVERFGLSDYLSLNPERPNEYEPVLVQEMLTLIVQIVQERRFSGLSPTENLRRELVHKLAIGDATHSQLVKSLPRDLSKLDRLQEILNAVAVYSNPSGFNQGMYSLHWMHWKELDLYHPRWNSRELQIAEERYTRYRGVSALTSQMPRWTKIYPPLEGVARIATCKVVLQIIRAVLFYAVVSDKSTETRAPDGVLLTSLHLLSLALDIYLQQRESMDKSKIGDSSPMLAFVVEEIREGKNYAAGDQSLLSLLVSLMKMHKSGNPGKFLEAGNCNISSLIESLLKKFGEVDSLCMTRLQHLAPEVVPHLSHSIPASEINMLGSASDTDKRKAKARERQVAILAKMKAEQSKFLSSINSIAEDDSKSRPEESYSDDGQDLEETVQDVCSLCHDPNSKIPVSFLILLQKSRLVSFIDRGPPLWDQVWQSDKEQVSLHANKLTDHTGMISSFGGLGGISSTQIEQLVQNAVSEFADYAQPGKVTAIVESNTQFQCASKDGNGRTVSSFDMLEQNMYFSVRREMQDNMLVLDFEEGKGENLAAECGLKSSRILESVLLGKYMAALSREKTEHPSSSENVHNENAQTGSTSQFSAYDGFGPADCDGVHLSSCGHAVHQACLDRYLSSLKERYIRRIIFEGGHIVDPHQGEFLCPVCRRLANTVLPSFHCDFQKAGTQPMMQTVFSPHAAGPLAPLSDECNSLWLQQALSLLQCVAKVVTKEDMLKSVPLESNERIKPNLESISAVLLKMYFSNKHDKLLGSGRVNLLMIMWDTLRYSLVSMEISARCGRSQVTPNYDVNALLKELKSSSGFVLSLLLKIVQNLRGKSSLHLLQRLRGIQLFSGSICSGVSMDCASSTYGWGGNMSSILKHADNESFYPDTQFWNRAADPILEHEAFSSLMWVLFCLPQPFLTCQESLLSLVHIFYAVAVVQAIITYIGKQQCIPKESNFCESLITDISKVLEEYGWIQQYFVSNYIDPSSDIKDIIRKLSFPYLRRCALLWKLVSTKFSAPFCDGDHVPDGLSNVVNEELDILGCDLVELNQIQELEKFFKIPPLDVVLKDQVLQSLAKRWLHHFCTQYEIRSFRGSLHSTPVVPFKLMCLPHLYQDLLQRYIKQRCADCNNVLDDPALCLLCGRLCSSNWKSCCRENGCHVHAMACGAGMGVFLLVKRTTIRLQRSARQALWPSPYLDAFGEEDVEMHRGKPLYLNEERYAALTCMVASHGLDRSSKVLGQTTIGTFFVV